MISGFRYQALALACIRHGVSPNQGRGLHSLPADVARGFVGSLVCSLEIVELNRAFRTAGEAMIVEVNFVDMELANRLLEPIRELTGG
jgi:hypothetical protein